MWVQGHTDDSPIVIRKPKGRPEGARIRRPRRRQERQGREGRPQGREGRGAAEPATTRCCRSSPTGSCRPRALTVVHYLQDEAKIDPSRLARWPSVSTARAASRRRRTASIEIVLYPRPSWRRSEDEEEEAPRHATKASAQRDRGDRGRGCTGLYLRVVGRTSTIIRVARPELLAFSRRGRARRRRSSGGLLG